jgi:hypothetical protein
LRSAFRLALGRVRPDTIVAFTDGYTPWPAAPPCPVVVGLFERDRFAVDAEDLGAEYVAPPELPSWARVVRIPVERRA